MFNFKINNQLRQIFKLFVFQQNFVEEILKLFLGKVLNIMLIILMDKKSLSLFEIYRTKWQELFWLRNTPHF